MCGQHHGVSTRLMGALIMTHSDDNGLVLPPKLAPYHVVIVPIYKGIEQLEQIDAVAADIIAELTKAGITAKYDGRDTHKPGWKFAEYEFKGVPLRMAIGPRDLENGTLEITRRDTSEKQTISRSGVAEIAANLLDQIQSNLYSKALENRTQNMHEVSNFEDFKHKIEHEGGFVWAHWDGTSETEEKIKELTKATIRCIPLDGLVEPGVCIYSGKPSKQKVLFAKAY